jgi:zinc protease
MRGRLAALLFALLALVPAEAGRVVPINALPGVVVWHSEDHTLPVIALSATFPAGSAYDPAGRTGMAALAAYLLNEGAGRMNADAYQAALAAKGIRLDMTPSRDYFRVTLLTLSSSAKEAFRLLGLALAQPRFDSDAVTRVRLQMLQSIEVGRADPSTVAERGFYSLYFGPYTYGRPVEGEPRGLAAITAAELHGFARTHWVRGGLKIAVAGDVSPAALAPLLQSAFGGLADATPPPPPPPINPGAPGLHILRMDVSQPAVMFGRTGLLRRDRDFIAAMIANYILGGAGSGSRLTRELREQRGLTYDVTTDLVVYRRTGLVLGTVSTRRDAVRQTISIVREVMRKFAAEGPTNEELADAKRYLNGSFPLAFTSNADIASQLNAFQRNELPLDYINRRAGMIEAVTLGDVRRVAHWLFDPARLTVVVAGSVPRGNTEPADSR